MTLVRVMTIVGSVCSGDCATAVGVDGIGLALAAGDRFSCGVSDGVKDDVGDVSGIPVPVPTRIMTVAVGVAVGLALVGGIEVSVGVADGPGVSVADGVKVTIIPGSVTVGVDEGSVKVS